MMRWQDDILANVLGLLVVINIVHVSLFRTVGLLLPMGWQSHMMILTRVLFTGPGSPFFWDETRMSRILFNLHLI